VDADGISQRIFLVIAASNVIVDLISGADPARELIHAPRDEMELDDQSLVLMTNRGAGNICRGSIYLSTRPFTNVTGRLVFFLPECLKSRRRFGGFFVDLLHHSLPNLLLGKAQIDHKMTFSVLKILMMTSQISLRPS
jgi:hypothetical protein